MLYVHLLGYLRLFDDEPPLQFHALPRALPLWAYLAGVFPVCLPLVVRGA
jgi:hypothetical protein